MPCLQLSLTPASHNEYKTYSRPIGEKKLSTMERQPWVSLPLLYDFDY